MVIMLIFVKQGCDDVTNTAQLRWHRFKQRHRFFSPRYTVIT
ncbi:Uncharacterized protein APZ42_019943 [Daphnia magna]|uniref:Uncharacterized protein n=1 Tax=Daphnia magna TaxID=35525 RepID=A0A164XU98_9CRUS|nr:Uncharacterized protein APZ42_019943 [Daphnia magna]